MPKVYLDETGFDTFYYRPYAYALRGQIVKARISGKRYERMSLVAARADGKLIAPMVYKGTMDSSLFEAWFGQFLLKELKEPSVIIMDHARFTGWRYCVKWRRGKDISFCRCRHIRLS